MTIRSFCPSFMKFYADLITLLNFEKLYPNVDDVNNYRKEDLIVSSLRHSYQTRQKKIDQNDMLGVTMQFWYYIIPARLVEIY